MHDHEQPDHKSGGVPHAFRQALAWRWADELPLPLQRGFLTMLHVMAGFANTSGHMRMRDGAVIRVQRIARSTCSDIKEVRRWLKAAEAAGVVGVQGERRRGVPTVYTLLLIPHPDWTAAVASLESSRRVRAGKKAGPWAEEPAATDLGGPAPQVEDASWGARPPNSGENSWGAQPPNLKGGPAPVELGGPAPQRPRVTQVLPQESADVGGHLTLGVASEDLCEPPEDDEFDTTPLEDDPFDVDPPPGGPPHLTLTTQGRRDARAAEVKTKSAGNNGQMPLLLPVRGPDEVATTAALRQAAEGDPDRVRQAIRQLGVAQATYLYGHRLVAPHLTDQTDTA